MLVYYEKQFLDFSGGIVTQVNIQFYSDARDALLKAMME